MPQLITPLDKVGNSSLYSLQAAAFDIDNTPAGHDNDTIDADTPKGVLGSMVAALASGEDLTVENADPTDVPLGLFSGNSEGNPFENSPAIASGVVPVYMGTGAFSCFVFETHVDENNVETSEDPGGSTKAINTALVGTAALAVGLVMYCSGNSLLTTVIPSTRATPGGDNAIALITKAPTASDLELGIRLLI